jgi:hypothetical protein
MVRSAGPMLTRLAIYRAQRNKQCTTAFIEQLFRTGWARRLEILRDIWKALSPSCFFFWKEFALTADDPIDELTFQDILNNPSGYAVVFKGFGFEDNQKRPSSMVTGLISRIVFQKSLDVPLWMLKLAHLRALDVVDCVRKSTLSECNVLMMCRPAIFCVPCCCRLFREVVEGGSSQRLLRFFAPLLKFYKKGTLVNLLALDKTIFSHEKYTTSICRVDQESLQAWSDFESSHIDCTMFPSRCDFNVVAVSLKLSPGVEMATKLPARMSQCGILSCLQTSNHDYCNCIALSQGYVTANSWHVSSGCRRLLHKLAILSNILIADTLFCVWTHSLCLRQY